MRSGSDPDCNAPSRVAGLRRQLDAERAEAAAVAVELATRSEVVERLTADLDETLAALGTAIVEIDEGSLVVDLRHVLRRRHAASAIKYGRFDDAAEGDAGVQYSLRRLRAELEDVDGPATEPLLDEPSSTLSGTDIWFDNIFSDLMAREWINASLDSMQQTAQRIGQLETELVRRRSSATHRVDELETEQRTLVSD